MTQIRAQEDLWANSMLPEGVVERWLVADGAEVTPGQAVVELRLEDARHEIPAPVAGRVVVLAAPNSVIEPGSLLGEIRPPG